MLCVLYYYVLNKPVPVNLTFVNVQTLVHTVTGAEWQMCTHTWLYNVTYTWVPIHVHVFKQCHLTIIHTHQAYGLLIHYTMIMLL